MPVEMKGLDSPWITQCRGHLRGCGRKLGWQALSQSGNFQEIASIVRPDLHWADSNAIDEIGRVGRDDHLADSSLAGGRDEIETVLDGRHHTRADACVSSLASLRARQVSATRFAARIRESKVPASVHQPSRCAKVMLPSSIYA